MGAGRLVAVLVTALLAGNGRGRRAGVGAPGARGVVRRRRAYAHPRSALGAPPAGDDLVSGPADAHSPTLTRYESRPAH
ncbi:hypothetical protein [Micromonospora sp. NPDC005324]|uniref:hypothetical protein n=1 Tax=Micromonospora sp. NPDC005324 TaxID=3157033 RepID=UPI0033A4EDE8